MNAQATTQGRDPSHLIGDVQGTVAAVERGDWVQAGLGMANTAMGIVGMAGNPLSGFLSAGFSWAMQHVDFLREPFDALLGNPQAIQKMSDSWLSASRQIEGIVADYRRTSVEETRGWHGRSADGYRAASKKHAAGLETLAKATKGISGAAKGAGELVASVRKTIMDLISKAVSDMVMKIIQWLSASFLTFGAAIGAAIADIVQMACNYAKKLADFLQKLAGSLKKLIDLIKSVAQIAQTAKQILQAITAMTSSNRGGGGGGGSGPRLTRGGVGLDERQLDDMHRDAGQRFTNPSGGTTNPSGSGGGGGTGGPVVSRPPTVGEGYPSGTGAPEPGRAYPGGPSGPVVSRPPTVGTGVGSGGSGGRPGGSGGGPGAGGHWEPGRWVPDGSSTSGRVPAPPSLSGTTYATGGAGGTPIVPTVPTVRPMSGDLPTTPTGGGSGGGAPAGGFGGGGGGFAGGGGGGGFAGGGGGGVGGGVGGSGGGGGGSTLQAGGSSGVLGQSGGAPGGAGAGAPGAGAAGGRPGGAGGGMGMMGAPMMGAPGQGGGDGKDHQRKVRLEGEPLIEEAPKAAKPVIGE